VFAGRLPVPPVVVTTCPTFKPKVLAGTLKVFVAARVIPEAVCVARGLKTRLVAAVLAAAPAVVSISDATPVAEL